MKLGIIGAGNLGSALARRFVAVGHDVSLANSRGPASLAELAKEIGAHAATVEDVARTNDVVVVTIPEKGVEELPAALFDGALAGVVVIDTGNYYPQQRDGRIDGIEAGLTESAWVGQQIGTRSSKPSIQSPLNICSKTESGAARAAESRSRSPVTTLARRMSS